MSSGPDTSDTVIFSLLHAAHALEERAERALEEVGLSWAKYGVLVQLLGTSTPLALGELAERLSCVRSNVTQLVDRLESDGLVRRTNDASDRRIIRTELTDLGRQRAEAGIQQWEKVRTQFTAEFSDTDLKNLERMLQTIR